MKISTAKYQLTQISTDQNINSENINFRYYTEIICLKLVSQPVSINTSNSKSILPGAFFVYHSNPYLTRIARKVWCENIKLQNIKLTVWRGHAQRNI